MAQRTAMVARDSVKRGHELLRVLDASLMDVQGTVSRWWAVRGDLNDSVTKLAYLVDGWCRIVDFWEGVGKSDRFEQREILEQIAQNLPIMPREAVGDDVAFWEDLKERQLQWGEMRRRRIGASMDRDTRDRLERFQKEPV
jgi:hypothetical protein